MSSTDPQRPAEPEQPADAAPPERPADAAPADQPEAPRGVEGGTPVADDVELAAVVDPARVRRAPRYKAFFWVGAVVGIVLGAVLGFWLVGQDDPATGEPVPLLKPGVYISVTILGTTMVTVLLAGLLAVLADRRSLRRR